jgi:hypothetical protein
MIFPIRHYSVSNPTTTTTITYEGMPLTDESPFDAFQGQGLSTFSIYIEPIRNTYYKTYQHVITFDAPPVGPLSNMVVSVNTPPLSEFQSVSAFSPPPTSRTGGKCIYVLSRYPKGSPNANPKHSNAYMSPRDIPLLYGFLQANGYTIDTRLTKMTYQTNVSSYIATDETANGYGHRKLVAVVHFNLLLSFLAP